MKVTLRLHAKLSDCLPAEARAKGALDLDVDHGTTIASLITRFDVPRNLCHLVLIDGVFVPPAARSERVLAEGETLAIWPPVAGG